MSRGAVAADFDKVIDHVLIRLNFNSSIRTKLTVPAATQIAKSTSCNGAKRKTLRNIGT